MARPASAPAKMLGAPDADDERRLDAFAEARQKPARERSQVHAEGELPSCRRPHSAPPVTRNPSRERPFRSTALEFWRQGSLSPSRCAPEPLSGAAMAV